MRTRSLMFFVFVITGLGFSYAQELLTVEEAIKKGLEKNRWIIISKNQLEIAKMQNTYGGAGMSPSIGVNSSYNFGSNNSHFEFTNGTVQDRTGAKSNNLGASLYLNWTVFDGMKMFAVKKRLSETEALSAIALKQQIEAQVYNLIVAYYNVVKANELLKLARKNLQIANERKKIATLKYEIGSDSKVEMLMARADENKAQSAMAQLDLQLLLAKTELNVLMDARADADFTTTDSIAISYNPEPEELRKNASANNLGVLFSKQSELVNEQYVKEARSGFLPQVQLNSAYNLTRNRSEAGFVFLSRQAGINAGISANWQFYSGGRNRRQLGERSILAFNQRLQTEQSLLQLDATVLLNYRKFLLYKKIMDLERVNVNDATELMEISMERYRVGKAALIETIEAQKNLQEAGTNYVNALFNIKIAETELLKVNGSLVK